MSLSPVAIESLTEGYLLDPQTPGLLIEANRKGVRTWRYRRQIQCCGRLRSHCGWMAERQASPQSGPSPDGLIVQLRALVLHRCELGSGFWSDQMLGEQPESGNGISSGFCIGACDIGAQFSEQIEFER